MPGPATEEEWRQTLTGQKPVVPRFRRAFHRIPSAPHCKLCLAPFGGIGGVILKPVFGPWEKNPQLCKNCIGRLAKMGVGGAEIPVSLLFADIRGSTGLGERLRPADFTALLNAFYRIAADSISGHDGVVDKFVGDEAIGLFIPAYAGHGHAAKAIAAGRQLLADVGQASASTAGAIPVGAGVHTGIAFVGTVGSSAEISDFTALGDAVNTTARLAQLAGPGELLVSDEAAIAGHLESAAQEHRTVEIRGREATLDVIVIEGS
jgi:adenylate cyclase